MYFSTPQSNEKKEGRKEKERKTFID